MEHMIRKRYVFFLRCFLERCWRDFGEALERLCVREPYCSEISKASER